MTPTSRRRSTEDEAARDATELGGVLRGLTTPHIADACLRRGIEVRAGPHDLLPLFPSGCRIAGPVRPVRHYGSVDVFLEALELASPGEVLVIDNAGRRDEACIGDLVVLEARTAGLAGIVVWGLHRDTAEILEIRFPVFSLGATPGGPIRLEARGTEALVSARVGPWPVGTDDVAIGDENGVLFVPRARVEEVAKAARAIRAKERDQAGKMRQGRSLRSQLHLSDFVAGRSSNPELTFREHLRRIEGSIEE